VLSSDAVIGYRQDEEGLGGVEVTQRLETAAH
jgi:hypothetical protein